MPINFSHSQYNSLLRLLRKYQHCWDHEILHGYPHTLERLPTSWLDCLAKLTHDELWLMDSKQSYSAIIDSELREMFEELEQLTQVPILETTPLLPQDFDQSGAFFRVRGKKRHEIERVAPEIKKLHEQLNFKKLVDVGGGQGHLARVLARHFGVPAISLDQDQQLQELGRKNLTRLDHRPPPIGCAPLEFEHCTLDEKSEVPHAFNHENFVLGLHTCGDLAIALMQQSKRAGCIGLLSFGCCYSKMKLSPDGTAYHGPKDLRLDINALTLATRGHKSDTRADFELKLLVKRHRYTLHLYHFHQLGIKKFVPMGETVAKEYRESFANYAAPRLATLGHQIDHNELNEFYESPWVKDKFKTMLLGNLIRWQFGRALELIILLDRCYRLEEQGFKTQIMSYFDERLSPRNIGILAHA